MTLGPATDVTGVSFLSYRRSRLQEARLLLQAQHDLGVPTWQDLDDLGTGQTETQLRSILASPTTANGLLWLTPEVQGSVVIRDIEAPALVRRHRAGDGFFLLPVLAGGLSYHDAAQVTGPLLGTNLTEWNLSQVAGDPISVAEAAEVARHVLRHRLNAIHHRLPAGAPLQLRVHTFDKPPTGMGDALVVDWSRRFDQLHGRGASADTWRRVLVPILETIVRAIATVAPGREVVARGKLTIPAAVALGVAFLTPRQLPITWQQYTPGIGEQPWSLSAPPEPSGFTAHLDDGAAQGTDLAVLVCVNDDTTTAFALTADATGTRASYRAILTIHGPGTPPHQLTAGQATHVAHVTRNGLHEARQRYQRLGRVHLFMAVPVGLAMMTGQLLNTVGSVQTYEYIADDQAKPYRPAGLLRPSNPR